MVNSLGGRLLAGMCIVLALGAGSGCRSKAPLESGLPQPAAEAPAPQIPGYLTAPRGGPLRDALGRCWRTADWRPALAIEECDPTLARERKLRELALKMSGVATVPDALSGPSTSGAVEARFEGAPPAGSASGGNPATAAAATPADSAAAQGAEGSVAGNPAAGAVAAAAGAPSMPGSAPPAVEPAAAPADLRPGYITKPVVLNTDAAFFFGKDRLTVAGKDAVENLAAYIKLWGIEEVQVEVVGHTDRIGSAKDNFLLSRKRADAVRQVLVEAGVPAGSITASGVGSTQPVTAPDTCPDDIDRCERINCLAPDRRVEVGLRGTRKAPAR